MCICAARIYNVDNIRFVSGISHRNRIKRYALETEGITCNSLVEKTLPSHRLRADFPALRLAATPPCLFIPRDLGRGANPFDFLHSSFREPRGPCVEIRFVDDEVLSRSIRAVMIIENENNSVRKDRLISDWV